MLSASFKSRRSRKLFSDQIHKLINAQKDLQAFHIQTQPAVTAQSEDRFGPSVPICLPLIFTCTPLVTPPSPPPPDMGADTKQVMLLKLNCIGNGLDLKEGTFIWRILKLKSEKYIPHLLLPVHLISQHWILKWYSYLRN